MKQCLAGIVMCLMFLAAMPLRGAEDDALRGVGPLLRAGKNAEARVEIEKARKAYAAAGNESGEGAATLLLATIDATLDKHAEAHAELKQSAAKFTAAGDALGAWMSLYVIADLDRREGKREESFAAHERSIAFLHDARRQTRFSLGSLQALGVVCGMPVEMLGMFMQSPEILKPVFLRFAEAMSRDGYGVALTEAGELDKADVQLQQANDISDLFGGMFDATIAAHIGDLRRRQWRFDEARQSYVKALDGVKLLAGLPLRDPGMELGILDDLADLELLNGHVDEALAWNDRALASVRAAAPRREASVLQDRGSLLVRAGRYREAEAVFDEALQLATRNGDEYRRAGVLGDLGGLHMFEGKYETAAAQLEQSIAIYQKLNETYLEAPTWITLAEVYTLLASDDSATFALDKARELAKKSGFRLATALVDAFTTARKVMHGQAPPAAGADALTAFFSMPEAKNWMLGDDGSAALMREMFIGGASAEAPKSMNALSGTGLILKGKSLLEHGDAAGARAVWNEALNGTLNRDHRAGCLGLIGASYWREGRSADAIRYFEEAAKTIETVAADVRVEELLAGYLGSERRWYYEILLDMLVHDGHVQEAFEQSERARARGFLQVVGNHRLAPQHGGNAALVQEAEILRTQIAAWEKAAGEAKAANRVQLTSDLQFARHRYQSVMERIKVTNPEYASLTTVEPLPLDAIRQELPANATLISYFVTTHAVHAWVVDRGQLSYATLPLDRAALQRVVCWASQFAPPRDDRGVRRWPSTCTASTAEEAYRALIAPLRANIHGSHLIIVPHGVLHYVPFAALRDATTGRYLLEDYTLSYIPSASALRFLRSKETPVRSNALVLGNPNSALPAAGRLPGAEEEAVAVARRLGCKPLLGADARESLFYHLNGRFDLLHIAAHAIYDPANPLFSRIALAPGNGSDGNLEVHEILSSVDLSGVNLVVLSACQTAVGQRSGGDDVVGLTRALLYAGTPGVISTLWNIDDTSSARLMDELYRRIGEGELVADALRDAQLMLSRSAEYRDPKYWAAFTLTGNPQGRWKAKE